MTEPLKKGSQVNWKAVQEYMAANPKDRKRLGLRPLANRWIVDQVAAKTGFTYKVSRAAVDAMIHTLVEALRSGYEINLTGMGTFVFRTRRERKMPERLSPQGKIIPAATYPATRYVAFRNGKALKRFGREMATIEARRAAENVPVPAQIKHGVDCVKAPHTGEGYLHAEDDDRPYDVDGCSYCGRCHMGF